MKEKIICILNNRASLTVGKEYEVISSNDGISYFIVINDNGDEVEYTKERFINKSEFRGHKLNQILK
jgi:hypothetical protein